MKSNLFRRCIIIVLSFLLMAGKSYGEGTKEVSPNSTAFTGLYIDASVGYGSYFGCPQDNRIYFNISDFTTERLYFGAMFTTYANSGNQNAQTDMWYRIYDPSGAQVAGPLRLYSSAISGTAGFIANHTQAVDGPNIGGVTTGYVPKSFTPSTNGDYWIEI